MRACEPLLSWPSPFCPAKCSAALAFIPACSSVRKMSAASDEKWWTSAGTNSSFPVPPTSSPPLLPNSSPPVPPTSRLALNARAPVATQDTSKEPHSLNSR
eukprot:352790-Chlamydomonas_euryale.AAC.4